MNSLGGRTALRKKEEKKEKEKKKGEAKVGGEYPQVWSTVTRVVGICGESRQKRIERETPVYLCLGEWEGGGFGRENG